MARLLLEAYPEAVSVKGWSNRTPLASAQQRVEKQWLSVSDLLIALLKDGEWWWEALLRRPLMDYHCQSDG